MISLYPPSNGSYSPEHDLTAYTEVITVSNLFLYVSGTSYKVVFGKHLRPFVLAVE